MSENETLGQRLCSLMATPSVKVVVEARLGNCGSDFKQISEEGINSMLTDAQFAQAASDALMSIKLQIQYAV